MSIKRIRPVARKSRLEREVIIAVVALYLLLSGALLVIHYSMPDGTSTTTSSTSPSHEHFSSTGENRQSPPDSSPEKPDTAPEPGDQP